MNSSRKKLLNAVAALSLLAGGAALDYIFACNARRVTASCLAENLSSRRVLEKCGFTQEGLLKQHTWHDGQWKDCAVYGKLRGKD